MKWKVELGGITLNPFYRFPEPPWGRDHDKKPTRRQAALYAADCFRLVYRRKKRFQRLYNVLTHVVMLGMAFTLFTAIQQRQWGWALVMTALGVDWYMTYIHNGKGAKAYQKDIDMCWTEASKWTTLVASMSPVWLDEPATPELFEETS